MYGIYSQQTVTESGATVTIYWGNSTSLHYSIDGGDTILPTNINGLYTIRSVKFINNKFYLLCGNTTSTHYIYESSDGITWTQKFNTSTTGTWLDFIYNTTTNMVIICSNQALTNRVMRNNGTNVIDTVISPNLNSNNATSIEYINGIYLLIGTGTSSSFRTSTDGITWTNRTLPVTGTIYGIQKMFYQNGILYGVYSVNTYYYNFTTNVWVSIPGITNSVLNITYIPQVSKWYIVTSEYLYYSSNGIDFTRISNPSGSGALSYSDITSNDDGSIITASTNSNTPMAYSTNGGTIFSRSNTSTTATAFVTYENDKFVAMQNTNKWTSTNGNIWTSSTGAANTNSALQVVNGVEVHKK